MPSLSLLGPQRLQPNLDEALTETGVAGPIAVVTAGWEERENEDRELRDHLPRATVNLRLFARTEEIFQRDQELLDGYRRRRARFAVEQELYRTRLAHALDACRDLLSATADSAAIESHREAAFETVRQLDAEHQERLRGIQAGFEDELRPYQRASVVAARRAVALELEDCAALAIAGGHVVVLLNRLRLFDLQSSAEGLPVIAWSAGAMVLAERVVAFHDSPPQGPGYAEVVENGLARYPGVLPLPHARRRLRLDDPSRVELLSRRFADLHCVPLDEGARVSRRGGGWTGPAPIRRLGLDGGVESIRPELLMEKR